jgi:hypothetical protein
MNSAKQPDGNILMNCPEGTVLERTGRSDIEIYEHDVPAFVERELEGIYECIYCTLARLRIYDPPAGASTYVARAEGRISAVFLFRQEKDEIKVLNQQIAISQEELRKFADAVFSRYTSARLISFYAINTKIDDFPFVCQQYSALEENVLRLPATADDYLASISANFRSTLRRAEKRTKKDFPSFRAEVVSTTDVGEDMVRNLISLAGARMAAKQKKAYIGEEHLGSIMRLIRTHGYVVAARVNGKVCGGSIWYCVGRRAFLHIIAHDPRFDQYMLGNQVLLAGVLHWIARGGRECWLMGGSRAHKAKFKTVPQYLDSMLIYRSRLQQLFHWRRASVAAAKRLMHRVRHQVREQAGRDSMSAPFFTMCLALGRSLKRLGRAKA